MAINIFKNKSKESKPEIREEKVVVSQDRKRAVLLPGAESALLHPHATEKSAMLAEQGQYVFQVGLQSTKHQVKSALEHLYGIHVERVHIIRIPPKKGRDRKTGRRKFLERANKKAVVSLRKGEKLELFAH